VRGGLAPEAMRLVDDRAQLLIGQLRRGDVITERKNASRGAHLDDGRAVLDVQADGLTALGCAMHDAPLDSGLRPERARRESGSVAVAAGRAERIPGHEHAGTGDQTLVDRIAQTDVDVLFAPDVADGGKSRV